MAEIQQGLIWIVGAMFAALMAAIGFGVNMILRRIDGNAKSLDTHSDDDARRFTELSGLIGKAQSKIHDETVRRLEGEKQTLRELLKVKEDTAQSQGHILGTLASITNRATKDLTAQNGVK